MGTYTQHTLSSETKMLKFRYIYCMVLVPHPVSPTSSAVQEDAPFGDFQPQVDYGQRERERVAQEVQLVTGSGDEDVKVLVDLVFLLSSMC